MKRLFLILCLLLLPSASYPGWYYARPQSAGVTTFCTSSDANLICEDFEGNDTCANLGHYVSGTADCQATDFKQENYGAKVTFDSAIGSIAMDLGSDQSTVFVKLNMRIDTWGNISYYVAFRNSSDALLASLRPFVAPPNNNLRLYHGVTAGPTSSGYSADTWYTVKLKYVASAGGSTGAMYMWIAPGENKALSTDTAEATLSMVDGSNTGSARLIRIYAYTSGETSNWYDNIEVSTTDPDA